MWPFEACAALRAVKTERGSDWDPSYSVRQWCSFCGFDLNVLLRSYVENSMRNVAWTKMRQFNCYTSPLQYWMQQWLFNRTVGSIILRIERNNMNLLNNLCKLVVCRCFFAKTTGTMTVYYLLLWPNQTLSRINQFSLRKRCLRYLSLLLLLILFFAIGKSVMRVSVPSRY